MMKRKIRKAFARQTPDVLHSVLSECGEYGDSTMQQDWQVITPKQEKRHLWLKIAAAAAALALVIGLSLIVLMQQNPAGEPQQLTEPTESTEPTTQDDEAALVVDAYYDEWKPFASGSFSYFCRVPRITIDSDYARQINAELRSLYTPLLESDGTMRQKLCATYEWTVKGDILFLQFYWQQDEILDEKSVRYGECDYYIYALHISDGSPATTLEILEEVGIEPDDFYANVKYILGEYYCRGIDENRMEYFLSNRPINLNHEIYTGFLEVTDEALVKSAQPYLYSADSLGFYVPESPLLSLSGNKNQTFLYAFPQSETMYYAKLLALGSSLTEYVSTSYSAQWQTVDGKSHHYEIPEIYIDSDYAQQVNAEINEIYQNWINKEHPDVQKVEFYPEWCIKGDILSLVYHTTWWNTDSEKTEKHYVYNMRITSGKKASIADVLSHENRSEESFYEKAKLALGNTYCCQTPYDDIARCLAAEDPNDATYLQFAKTVSQENLQNVVPYLDAEGTLSFMGTVYQSDGTASQKLFSIFYNMSEHSYYQQMLRLMELLQSQTLVIDAYNSSQTSELGTTYHQVLPQIMLRSDYADEINAQMLEIIESIKESADSTNYSYETNVHGDLLTLIVTEGDDESEMTQLIYTLRISDGAKATREEILAYAGVAEHQFVQKTRKILSYTYAADQTPGMVESLLYDAENSRIEESRFCETFCKTVCLDNINDTVVYLNRDGELCLLAKVYQIAGADYHEEQYLYSMSVEKSQYYDRFMLLCYLREPILFENLYGEAVSEPALTDVGAKRGDVTELQCRAVYPLDSGSYYAVTFVYQGETYEYHIDMTDLTILRRE